MLDSQPYISPCLRDHQPKHAVLAVCALRSIFASTRCSIYNMYPQRYAKEWSGPQLYHHRRVSITKQRDSRSRHVACCEHVKMMMLISPFG